MGFRHPAPPIDTEAREAAAAAIASAAAAYAAAEAAEATAQAVSGDVEAAQQLADAAAAAAATALQQAQAAANTGGDAQAAADAARAAADAAADAAAAAGTDAAAADAAAADAAADAAQAIADAAHALDQAQNAPINAGRLVAGPNGEIGPHLVYETGYVEPNPENTFTRLRLEADHVTVGYDRLLPLLGRVHSERLAMNLGGEDVGQHVYDWDEKRLYWWAGGSWRELAFGDETTGNAWGPPVLPAGMTGSLNWRKVGRLVTVSPAVSWSGLYPTSFTLGALPEDCRPMPGAQARGWGAWNGYVPGYCRIAANGVVTVEQAAATNRTSFAGDFYFLTAA